MAKYKDLKDGLEKYKDQAITARIMLSGAESKLSMLEDELDQMTAERNAARAAEADKIRQNIMLKRQINNPPPAKLILINKKLQNEVNHLRRLVNTRRRSR